MHQSDGAPLLRGRVRLRTKTIQRSDSTANVRRFESAVSRCVVATGVFNGEKKLKKYRNRKNKCRETRDFHTKNCKGKNSFCVEKKKYIGKVDKRLTEIEKTFLSNSPNGYIFERNDIIAYFVIHKSRIINNGLHECQMEERRVRNTT